MGRQLQDQMRRTGKGFKETLHDLLARGLARSSTPSAKTFEVKPKAMGLRAGIDPSSMHDLDTDLEVDHFLKVTELLSTKK